MKLSECPYCGAAKRDERDFECGSHYEGDDEVPVHACGAGKVVYVDSNFFEELMSSPEKFHGDETWVGDHIDPRYDNPFNRRRNSIDGENDEGE